MLPRMGVASLLSPPARELFGLLLVLLAAACSCEEKPAGSVSQALGGAKPPSQLVRHSPLQRCASTDAAARGIRVASWNIRAARNAELEQLAKHLDVIDADVIALQEVDWDTERAGHIKQAKALAKTLRLHYVFAGAHEWQGGDYGLAMLSRFPLVSVRRHPLPSVGQEPRILLEVEVCAAGTPLVVFNHHADITSQARAVDFARLVPLIAQAVGAASIVAADMNEAPNGPSVAAVLHAGYLDPFATQELRTTATARLDYLLLSPVLLRSLHDTQHWPTHSSDHAALSVDLNWP